MPQVTALYRYPVKGFTPEPVDELVIQPDGRVAGDRVLAFRFADDATPESRDGLDYWPKAKGLCLQDFPSLARMRVTFDGTVLTVCEDGAVLVSAGLDREGRRELCDAVTDRVLSGPDARRLRRPGRLPLELVGDGVHARFQDRPRGFISLHGEASVRDLGGTADRVSPGVDVDDRRFRSNIVVDGLDPWQELEWAESGTTVRVGEVLLTAQKPIVRCAAVTANPDSGVRDVNLLKVLTRDLGQREPTLGVLMLPYGSQGPGEVGSVCGTGGTVRPGDRVSEVHDPRTGSRGGGEPKMPS